MFITSWLPRRITTLPPLLTASFSRAIAKSRTPRVLGPRSIRSPSCTSTASPPDQEPSSRIRPACPRIARKAVRSPWTSPTATRRGSAPAPAAARPSASRAAPIHRPRDGGRDEAERIAGQSIGPPIPERERAAACRVAIEYGGHAAEPGHEFCIDPPQPQPRRHDQELSANGAPRTVFRGEPRPK